MKDFKYLKLIFNDLNKDLKKKAEAFAAGKIKINLHELESLINPDKFDFKKEEIETIGVKID